MPNQSSGGRVHPLFIVGFLIMAADLIAVAYWVLAIQRPRAIALKSAGQWALWDEIIDKLILIGFWVIGYMGYTIGALPDNKWDWRRAAKSGLEAMVSGVILRCTLCPVRPAMSRPVPGLALPFQLLEIL